MNRLTFCALASIAAAATGISVAVSAAHADTLMYHTEISVGAANNFYSTPLEAVESDAATYNGKVGAMCGVDLPDRRIYFHVYTPWDGHNDCGVATDAWCVTDDGPPNFPPNTYYPPDVVNNQSFKCRCPTGEFWDPVSNVCTNGYYVTGNRPSKSELGSQCCAGKSRVGDPIDPSDGNVSKFDNYFDTIRTSTLSIKGFYNSLDSTSADIGANWRHSFSRKIQSTNNSAPYSNDLTSSSLYADAATACVSGFAEIQAQVSNWQSASASYSNGVCLLSKSGATIGALSVLTSSTQLPVQLTTITGVDAIRDDGQVIRFTMQNGELTAPPTVLLKLQQTASGFVITDERDNSENYDIAGKLVSVVSKAGVVQTMNYDSSSRLSSVADNFGHSLSLSYDSHSRLFSVTRQ